MKSFVFTMERMRNYKSQLLDGEKSTLRHLRRERDEIEEKIREQEAFRRHTEDAFHDRQKIGISFQEMQAFRFQMENARMAISQLQQDMEKANEAVELQLQIVVRATQEVSGLDKLEEKQLGDYRQALTAESRDQILEQVSNKESRKRQNA